MEFEAINPDSLAQPKGYNNGMKGSGDVLFVAGQVGWNREGHMVSADFVAQFDQALENVLAIVWHAGGKPSSIGRMTIYVTDKEEYRQSTRQLGRIWRDKLGKHYPAMALVEVKALLEDEAKVEIEATALI